MFAARHLRYEIYEKKQVQPLLNQLRRRRTSRSTPPSRSETSGELSSLTIDPRSPPPDTAAAGAGLPELPGVGEQVSASATMEAGGFSGSEAAGVDEQMVSGSGETPGSDAAVCPPLPDHQMSVLLPTVDVSLCRLSPSTLAAFTHHTPHSSSTHVASVAARHTGSISEMEAGYSEARILETAHHSGSSTVGTEAGRHYDAVTASLDAFAHHTLHHSGAHHPCSIITHTVSGTVGTETGPHRPGDAVVGSLDSDGVCKASGSWPSRSFPLVDDDYHQLCAASAESGHADEENCVTSASVPAAPITSTVNSSGDVRPAESDDSNWTSETDTQAAVLR